MEDNDKNEILGAINNFAENVQGQFDEAKKRTRGSCKKI